MAYLTRSELLNLEQYAEQRGAFRARVMEHKRTRRLALGEHAALYFEDRVTIQYQVQEMLRIERIFESRGIQEELDVYNPLIPDGHNWKATFMIEYADVHERRQALARLIGIEQQVWLQVGDQDRIKPVANEDLGRSTADKTAAVHFLRFELDAASLAECLRGIALRAGIDHPEYRLELEVPSQVQKQLINDLR